MGQRIPSSLARRLAVLVAPVLVLGVMAGMVPASAASPPPHQSGARAPADAVVLAAAPASLQAAIGGSLGTSVSAAGHYSQTAELTASDGAPDDQFGYSVALSASGATALVGAPERNSSAGAAYVFRLRGGTWAQTAELTISAAAPGDEFGYSVALSASGTTALVGAPERNSDRGAAYVFRLRGGTWAHTAELTASHRAPGDFFGGSAALSASGTTALLTSSRHKSSTGAAYVFGLRGTTWANTAELTASNGAPGDGFGVSAALSASGTTALIGADGRNSDHGAAYVFTLQGGTWSQTAELTASHGATGDFFGDSAALSAPGTTALIGADGRNSFMGAAYVFTLRGGTWSQTAELTASHGAPFDSFGGSAALSALGTTVLIGASAHPAAYVFARGGA